MPNCAGADARDGKTTGHRLSRVVGDLGRAERADDAPDGSVGVRGSVEHCRDVMARAQGRGVADRRRHALVADLASFPALGTMEQS